MNLEESTNWLQLLGETNRVRLLALLEGHDLTVAELTTITDLGQSRVSTHLGKLREAGVVRDRKAGASTYYGLAAMPEPARKLWQLLRGEIDDHVLSNDRERREKALQARAGWPESFAGEMERHYSPGRTWEAYARGLAGLLGLGRVLDIGAGDGAIAELLAPHAEHVTCFDRSEKLLDAAKARLRAFKNVAYQSGDMHEIPFKAAAFDQVLAFNVLTHSKQPKRVLTESARVLRKRGTLAIVTLAPHSHPEVTAQYQHVHPGFSPDALSKLLEDAGFKVRTCEVAFREKREPHFPIVTAFAELK